MPARLANGERTEHNRPRDVQRAPQARIEDTQSIRVPPDIQHKTRFSQEGVAVPCVFECKCARGEGHAVGYHLGGC